MSGTKPVVDERVRERRTFLAQAMRDYLARHGSVWVRAQGRSMAPTVRLGDRVRLEAVAVEDLRKGQLIAYLGEDAVLRTHRVVGGFVKGGERFVVTRGDNERGADLPVPMWAVIGRMTARERFGQIHTVGTPVWRIICPACRMRARARVLARSLRRRERRRAGRVKDRLAAVVAEAARLHPVYGPEFWLGLGGEDAKHLEGLLRRHRIAMRMAEVLDEDAPGWAREAAEREAARWRAACVTSLIAVDAAIRALARVVGERMLVLKGPSYAERLYGGSCARPFSDLDVVVEPGEVPACAQALTDAGWRYRPRRRFRWQRRFTEHDFLPGEAPANLRVELHTGLVDKREFVPLLSRRPAMLWQEALPAEVAGHACMVLSPEATLLHAALHWHLHNYAGLLWGLDVAMAAAGRAGPIDWPRTVSLARAWGMSLIAWVALALASLEHDAPVPPEVIGELRPRDRIARWLVRRVAGRDPVFRRERRPSVEQALVLTLRDGLFRRMGAAVMLPLRVLAWEREHGEG